MHSSNARHGAFARGHSDSLPPRASVQVSGAGGGVGVQSAPPPRVPPLSPLPPVYSWPSGGATVARVTRHESHARITYKHVRRTVHSIPDTRKTNLATLGARVECAGVDLFNSRARTDSAVSPSEHPAMATETVWHPGGAAAGGEQQYSLRWNDFHSAMVSSFRRLRDEEDFVDVTLACAGATFTAHKVVLSACSPYFRRLLKANPCQHPIVILRDVHDKDMESLLRFMYQGEVHIGQEQLKEFLRAAQLLQVRGLTDVPPPAPLTTLEQKASPSASSWTETGSGGSREGRDTQREGRRSRRPDEGANNTPPPKRARSSDLYQAQMKTRTEQLLASQGSPERLATNGHEMALFSHALENAQNPHLSNVSNNLSGDGEESSSDAGASDTEGENRTKQEPVDYDDPATMANTNGALPHNFPGLLNLPGFPGLPGPSGIPDNFGELTLLPLIFGATWAGGGEGKPAKDERFAFGGGYANGEPAKPACPECGKLYSNNSNLKQHILNVHAARELAHACPVCGKGFKTRQYMQIHMNSIHGVKQRRRDPAPGGSRGRGGDGLPAAVSALRPRLLLHVQPAPAYAERALADRPRPVVSLPALREEVQNEALPHQPPAASARHSPAAELLEKALRSPARPPAGRRRYAARGVLAKPVISVHAEREERGSDSLKFFEGDKGLPGQRLQCPLCFAILDSLAYARLHLEAHYPRDSPVCPVASCARYFAHPNSVRNHMRIKHRRQWEKMKTLKWSCGGCRRTQDLLRVRATDPRPCPKCGKIYRSAHTLRTHLEDKHTVCPGYRCVLCGTVAKSRNSLHSHMSRQHRGISTKDLPVLQMPTRFDPELASQLLAKAGVKVSPEQLRARASPTGPRRSDIKLDAKSAASESSSICGDNDHDDLSQSKYQDSIPVSPPHINNLTNTTITKVPAVRAVTAKAVENLPHGMTGMKHDDYPPGFGGGSALLDTYLQYIGENVFGMNAAKLAQMNAMHIERKTYDEPSPQMGSLPPPPTTLAHQRFLKQMQRQYTENMGKPDIMRDSEEPLDLGKERQRNDSINDETDRQDMEKDLNKDYYNKGYNDDDRSRIHMSEDRETMGHEDDFSEEDNKAAAS
ncbi:unnamed protein product [Pieris brassicae]|uniref:BTB domain-containing protein n=1 Tax=Pieris brassicae TaxID=7116 RepID=A0A9P0T511_PIEBR|nr:unnamed protein product [Pieris brassicae]